MRDLNQKDIFLIILGLVSILLQNNLFAQKSDSLPLHEDVWYNYANELNEYYTIDTGIEQLHNYRLTDENFDDYNAFLGNLASPYQSLLFKDDYKVGFDNGFERNCLNQFNVDKIKYYTAKVPYSFAKYVQWKNGERQEQKFDFFHTQNINKRTNIGFHYRRMASDGMYQNQRSSIHNFRAWNSYKSKNNRYQINTGFTLNNMLLQENGGITDDSFFYKAEFDNRATVNINLSTASNKQINKTLQIQQSWDFGTTTDEVINDSTTITHFKPKTRLKHIFTYDTRYFVYRDDPTVDTGFYTNSFLHPFTTIDSFHFRKIKNELIYKSVKSSKLFNFSTGIEHSFYQINYAPFNAGTLPVGERLNRNINNLILKGTLHSDSKQTGLYYNANANISLIDYNAGDYKINALLGYYFRDITSRLSLQLSSQSRSPDYRSNFYWSNYFQWNNNFNSVNSNSFKVDWFMKKIKFQVGTELYLLNNYIYFDTLAIAKQATNSTTILKLYLKKDFELKHFHLNNRIYYQQFSGSDVIRKPNLILKHSLFYENWLFKRALNAMIGIDIRYQNNYLANAYMPATSIFYIQNNTTLSFYPIVDFFINMRIQKARIFIMLEQVNQGLFDFGYYQTPKYPIFDRQFKIGVSWRFFE